MNKEENNPSKCPICGRPTHKKSKYCIFHASANEKNEEEFKKALKEYVNYIKKYDFDYDFKGFIFPGYIDFEEDMNIDVLKNSNFGNAVFNGDTILSKTIFLGYTNFGKASFKKIANFYAVTFKDYVYFGEAIFEESVFFINASFNSKAYFGNAVFKKEANFYGAIFKKEAYFTHTYFKKDGRFDDAKFKEIFYFRNARFLKPRESISTLSLKLKFKEETYLKDLDDFFGLFRSIYMKILYIYKFSNEERKKIEDRDNVKLIDLSEKGFEYFKKNYFKVNKQNKPRLKAIKMSSPIYIDIVALTSILGIIFLTLRIYENSQKIKINKLEIESRELQLEDYKKFTSIKNKIYNQMNRELIDDDLEKNLEKLGKYVKESDLK